MRQFEWLNGDECGGPFLNRVEEVCNAHRLLVKDEIASPQPQISTKTEVQTVSVDDCRYFAGTCSKVSLEFL